MGSPRRAAVLGSPIEHSLSPVLHGAAYRELGLGDWVFERVLCTAEELPGFVDGLGPEWAGLAVTMPGKRAALAYATERTRVAELVGAANTLVPRASGGWLADCTDVEGVVGSLAAAGGVEAGGRAVVLGAGGTATAALTALEALKIPSATIVVRDPARAGEALSCAGRVGVEVDVLRWDDVDFAAVCGGADLVVSTVPVGAVEPVAGDIVRAGCVFDVIYHPWPTPLAQAASDRGTRVVTGLDMLLHQAFAQVRWFTGLEAPREAMRAALRQATGTELSLPV
ncbi:shikimate dehydrogenase [Kutzneria kofuensis]|uniref:Shikimate dehydrogenase n=1 Tax=Kutzneria kofuensis TaxID=103725 RepID=A0A7W9KCF1_9PSEU|nr:shikimate dehydrogenase [Kutzneria kofuensis]MBB5889608.1 shikimate dehydrogenase [Kutzneria kofuensis]